MNKTFGPRLRPSGRKPARGKTGAAHPRSGRVLPCATDDKQASQMSPDAAGPPPEHLDSISYWEKRDRWAALGKQLALMRDEARRLGVPIEEVPGARALIEAFKHLGRELDRRAR